MSNTLSVAQVASTNSVTSAIQFGALTIVASYINFFGGETTFAEEVPNIGFDRRIRVPLGQMYVIPDCMIDNLGHSQVYFSGETVYLSQDKRDSKRKIYKLNQYGAQYVVTGQRKLPGISIADTDVASVRMMLTVEINNSRLLLEMYPDRKNSVLQDVINDVLNKNVRDDVWSVRTGKYVRDFTDAVNQMLYGNGVRLVVANVALVRTMPQSLNEIVRECRLAEHRLIDVMDNQDFVDQFDKTFNSARINTLKNIDAHRFLNDGDLTEFVERVTDNRMIQGTAFLDLVIHKTLSIETDLSQVKTFVSIYAGIYMGKFFDEAVRILHNGEAIGDLALSIAVLRSSFSSIDRADMDWYE